MSVKIIAAVGKNGELGKNGDLCFHIKEDMKFFREQTYSHQVIMGKKTWESIDKKPLKGRKNYVVTHNPDLELPEGVSIVANLEKMLETYADIPPENEESYRLFVIGGASVYKESLPYVDEILLTEIDAEDKTADTFFPEFDKSKFERTVLKKGKENGLSYSFVSYKRK